MATEYAIATKTTETTPRVSEWQRFRRIFFGRKLVVFGLAIFVIFLFIIIFCPLIAPYPANEMDLTATLQRPNSQHWLGTDETGRDVFSRVLYGSRTSLEIGLSVVLISGITGMFLGTIAGYYGGWVYNIVMRIVDALMSFPLILFCMLVAMLLGSGMKNVVIALSIASIPGSARLMCAQVLSIKENDYIVAQRSMSSSDTRVLLSHILPNTLPPIIVYFSMMLGGVILAEAALSFIGIGIKPPTATWGGMINDGREYLLKLPMLSFAPGFCLMAVVFAVNMIGDGLRDALDPRLRGTL